MMSNESLLKRASEGDRGAWRGEDLILFNFIELQMHYPATVDFKSSYFFLAVANNH